MTFVVDIDDTLIKSDKLYCSVCGRVHYEKPEALKEVEFVNTAYKNGDKIILHTGRNWDSYALTVRQLESLGVKYHELVMGKPQGIYIDVDSYKSIGEYWGEEAWKRG